ncbi:MAG: glycoside hydrolase family 43 protein [Bacteroidota bacterium]
MKFEFLLFFAMLIMLSCSTKNTEQHALDPSIQSIPSADIHVRDPFILVDQESRTYYLYASIDNRTKEEGQGVEVYTSKDLQHWAQAQIVFRASDEFWGQKYVWAPEVHSYQGKYYLFVTFTSPDTLEPPSQIRSVKRPIYNKRGSQILVSDAPTGPFKPFANRAHTNIDWMTIDGTFWEENGQPYMLYCHEWTQAYDGTMDLIALEDDLSAVKGDNQVLFKGSEAPWVHPMPDGSGYMTDGCFLYKSKTGQLLMIWSSRGEEDNAIGIALSESGGIKGPWKHHAEPLIKKGGLHASMFTSLEGQLVLAVHHPNTSPEERMQLYKLKDMGDHLKLEGKLF